MFWIEAASAWLKVSHSLGCTGIADDFIVMIDHRHGSTFGQICNFSIEFIVTAPGYGIFAIEIGLEQHADFPIPPLYRFSGRCEFADDGGIQYRFGGRALFVSAKS
jgi:hypothetical protein